MPKVSVIIPVFNVEKYLATCIESLINQTLYDIEFIFINDGSEDNSQQIIEEFQKKDSRIILINQANQGVSVARNIGIETANGEYIGFVDADDYLETDMYERLWHISTTIQVDIVVSGFITEQNGALIIEKTSLPINTVIDKKYIQENIILSFLKEDSLNSCCNKLYRKKIINSNTINFPSGIAHGEDGLFNIQCFNVSNKVLFTEYFGYHYREVDMSATRNILSKDYFQIALDEFNYDHRSKLNLSLAEKEIYRLKSVRFVNAVISLIHIYFKPNSKIQFIERFLYIRKMIKNQQLQKALHESWNELISSKGKYQLFILKCLKAKSILGLVAATQYSNYRNKI